MTVISCLLYFPVLHMKSNMFAESSQTGYINSTLSLPSTLVASSALHYLFESVCCLNIAFACFLSDRKSTSLDPFSEK